MRIKLNSVFVTDQNKALKFYTEILRFIKKQDIPAGEFRWLTVTSPEDPAGPELTLEPNVMPFVKAFQEALYEKRIPLTAFQVDDIQKEFVRLKELGVKFSVEPQKSGPIIQAIFDDTCGNFIGIYQVSA